MEEMMPRSSWMQPLEKVLQTITIIITTMQCYFHTVETHWPVDWLCLQFRQIGNKGFKP